MKLIKTIVPWLKKCMTVSRKQNVMECLLRCNPSGKGEELLDQYLIKKSKYLSLSLLSGLVLAGIIFVSEIQNQEILESNQIIREDYLGTDKKIPAIVKSEHYEDFQVDIPVTHHNYTKEEVDVNFIEAEEWFLNQVLLQNDSFEYIVSDLSFPSSYQEKQVDIQYASSNYAILSDTGKIHNEEIDKEEKVTLRVTFSYENYSTEKNYLFHVFPKILSKEETFEKEIEDLLDDVDGNQKETNSLILPSSVGKESIQFVEKKSSTFALVIVLFLFGSVLLSFGMDRDVVQTFQRRKEDLLYSYPEFVSKLALLIGSGMSVTGAIRRIYNTLESSSTDEALTQELGIFIRNIDNGISTEIALEELGRRTSLSIYRKFCSILITNMKKGSINLKTVLNEEAEQAFLLYQSQIRKKGEEASTKLLLPMSMMLGVVIAIILVPAFLTYQI